MAPAGYWHQSHHGNCFDSEKFFPRKKDEFVRLCPNKRFTHTYLQAVSLRLLVSCQMVIFRRFKSGFYAKQMQSFPNSSSALYVHVAPFDFASCDRVIYWLEKAHRRLQKQTLGWKDAQIIFTAMMRSRRFERSHMTSASVAVKWPLIRPLWNWNVVVA